MIPETVRITGADVPVWPSGIKVELLAAPNAGVVDFTDRDLYHPGLATTILAMEHDPRYRAWPGQRLYGAPLRIVAALLAQAAAVLTIDNGVRHLAAAVGANLYALSGRIPLEIIASAPVREGQRIVEEYVELPRVTARTLSRGAERLGLL